MAAGSGCTGYGTYANMMLQNIMPGTSTELTTGNTLELTYNEHQAGA